MQKIELSGAVGEEIELSYKGDTFVVKLGDRGIVPDITNAAIKAIKKDANAFLYAAQLIFRGNLSGEHYAKEKVAGVVKAMFDEIPTAKAKEETKSAAKVEKKTVEETKPAKDEKKVVEEAPSVKTEETPKAEEPKPDAKAESTEKKSESTTKKTSATTTKKTSTTTAKKKSA